MFSGNNNKILSTDSSLGWGSASEFCVTYLETWIHKKTQDCSWVNDNIFLFILCPEGSLEVITCPFHDRNNYFAAGTAQVVWAII